MWLSQKNIDIYTGRPAVSNEDVDGTLVIGNYRVIYNMGSRYGGSPYHQGQNSHPVTGNVHYQASVPPDDMYLGTSSFNKLHAPGNGAFDDTSVMREQISFWLVRKIGIPYGSVARGDDGPDSDIDLLVVMPIVGSATTSQSVCSTSSATSQSLSTSPSSTRRTSTRRPAFPVSFAPLFAMGTRSGAWELAWTREPRRTEDGNPVTPSV